MNDDILSHNRVILCHYDSYSAALLFARFGTSVLAPSPLPDGAGTMTAATTTDALYESATALNKLTAHCGLEAANLSLVDDFQEWVSSAEGPIRIHLARFTTFEAPRDAIEPRGGVFKPISELRGTAMIELNLLRRAFNLIMGGS